MFHKIHPLKHLGNKKGFGLIAAIFVVVIMSLFGLVVARHIATDTTTSAEDYLWAQGLYAAEAAAQLKILCYDGGGTWAGACGAFTYPEVNRFSTQETVANDGGSGNPSIISVRATLPGIGISREIEIKYIL